MFLAARLQREVRRLPPEERSKKNKQLYPASLRAAAHSPNPQLNII